jgi:hypothetical protein
VGRRPIRTNLEFLNGDEQDGREATHEVAFTENSETTVTTKRGQHPKSRANLKRFRKGVSPNPGGRPKGLLTAFPLAREASPVAGGVNGHTAQIFVQTSPRSWAEADIEGLLASGQVSLDESKGDKKGPIAIASAVTARATSTPPPKSDDADAPRPETRLAVFGDSDFVANGGLGVQGNKDLFMNTIGWLSQQQQLVSIPPRK